jgi:hypothetical protein
MRYLRLSASTSDCGACPLFHQATIRKWDWLRDMGARKKSHFPAPKMGLAPGHGRTGACPIFGALFLVCYFEENCECLDEAIETGF